MCRGVCGRSVQGYVVRCSAFSHLPWGGRKVNGLFGEQKGESPRRKGEAGRSRSGERGMAP